MEAFLQSDLFNWAILPALIFVARIADVSMGTVRMILIARGIRWLAPLVGFFEVIIWIAAMGQIMSHLSNPLCYLAFGAGYATGTYVGMLVEGRIHIGKAVIRTITAKEASGLIEALRAAHVGVTTVAAEGAMGHVKIVFSVVERRDLDKVIGIIRSFDPGAFYTVGDVRFVSEGVFPRREPAHSIARLAGSGK